MNSVGRRTAGWLAFGLLLIGLVLWVLPASTRRSRFPVVAVTSHRGWSSSRRRSAAVSRWLPGKRDGSSRLLAYALVTGLAVSVPMGYLGYSPNYGGFPGEWVVLGILLALYPAAIVKGRERSRRRAAQ